MVSPATEGRSEPSSVPAFDFASFAFDFASKSALALVSKILFTSFFDFGKRGSGELWQVSSDDMLFEGRGVPEACKGRGGMWGVAGAGSSAPWDGAAMSQRGDVPRVARALGP